jgi:hypothetical protein
MRSPALLAVAWLGMQSFGASAGAQTPAAVPPEPASEVVAEAVVEPVAADAPAAEANAAPFELSGDELEQLGFGTGKEAAVDTNFHISGFADFGIAHKFIPKTSLWNKIEGPWDGSFAIGNFNAYLSKNLNASFRTMGEVRFLYLPNGIQPADPEAIGRYDGSAPDYNDFNRPLQWGGVEIERVYLEWSIHPQLSLRVGQFLTPYGIWNVDHGSPTVIPIERPFVIGIEIFPERQTGFEAFGRYEIGSASTLGYHLTLSNGDGPASEWFDPDKNKAVGARVYWENRSLGELRVGASAYYGLTISYTIFRPDGLQYPQKINSQFWRLSWAADAQWKYKGLHVQGEILTQQRKWTEQGRTLIPNNANGQPAYFADWQSWGLYVLAGYRLPWFGIMPYALIMTGTFNISALRMSPINGTFGINIRPVDSVVVKVEYIHTHPFRNTYFKDELRRLGAQVAWAF